MSLLDEKVNIFLTKATIFMDVFQIKTNHLTQFSTFLGEQVVFVGLIN